MSAAPLVLIVALLAVAAVRMTRGHWMPIHSEHAEVDYRSLTLGGLPMEEIFDPATAVRHPYPLSEPHEPLVLVDAFSFEQSKPDCSHDDHYRYRIFARFRHVPFETTGWPDNPS